MIGFLKKLKRNERGNVLLITAAAMPLLVGSAGLATDTIQWALWKRQLQRAADSAAIAGVYQRVQDGGEADVVSAVERDLDYNQHTGIDLFEAPDVDLLADMDTNRRLPVRVELKIRKALTFSSFFLETAPVITANATAASVPGTDDYCVVSLEDTTRTGISGSGNVNVEMNCGMITNSVAPNSASAQGNSVMSPTVIASAGGIQKSDNWEVDKYDPYVTAMKDPFEDVDPNPPSECTGGVISVGAGDTQTINAGCYDSISVGSGGTLNLNPGTYYISGGSINVQGTLTGEGVTLVLTNVDASDTAPIGSFDMNAQASIDLSAPESGDFAGIAIYQDRRAQDILNSSDGTSSGSTKADTTKGNGKGTGNTNTTGNETQTTTNASPNKINGGSSSKIEGAIYFPKQQVTWNGASSNDAVCTMFVVRRIVFNGNNTTVNFIRDGCPGGANPFQGGRRVRLVA